MAEEKINVPLHVGIIMDGNGRWAKLRNKPREYGHKRGAEILEKVVTSLFAYGVKFVSLYAFSTENMKRPQEEVENIFDILEKGIKKYGELAVKKQVKFVVSGSFDRLPASLVEIIEKYSKKTSQYDSHILNILVNYGGKQDICQAVLKLNERGEEISPQNIDKYLYNQIPPLDLIIRPGGEKRLSNFMLWQASYAEIYFSDVLWPDFDKEETEKALLWFNQRKRRFGKL